MILKEEYLHTDMVIEIPLSTSNDDNDINDTKTLSCEDKKVSINLLLINFDTYTLEDVLPWSNAI